MWIYSQYSAEMRHNANLKGVCYSGHGEGENNPNMQEVKDVGPIPRGKWTIGPPQDNPQLGKLSMKLHPAEGTDTFGRDDFWIHGDSRANAGQGMASHGCIVAYLPLRREIANSQDTELIVVP